MTSRAKYSTWPRVGVRYYYYKDSSQKQTYGCDFCGGAHGAGYGTTWLREKETLGYCLFIYKELGLDFAIRELGRETVVFLYDEYGLKGWEKETLDQIVAGQTISQYFETKEAQGWYCAN